MAPDGTVDRLQARLVAKGFTQVYGMNSSYMFEPVAKMTSVRLFIYLAATYSWPFYQMDVRNAFLNGNLEEEVYMEQPPGYGAQGESGKVCRLRRSLYGFQKSPKAWFGRFSQVVLEFGLKRWFSDHSVFYRVKSGKRFSNIVYVYDI
jgi:hypothetical protein